MAVVTALSAVTLTVKRQRRRMPHDCEPPLDQTSPGRGIHLSEQRLTPLMEQMEYERNRTAVWGGSAGRSLLVYRITRIINDWIQQEPFTATKISLSPSFDKTPSAHTAVCPDRGSEVSLNLSALMGHPLHGQGWRAFECLWGSK